MPYLSPRPLQVCAGEPRLRAYEYATTHGYPYIFFNYFDGIWYVVTSDDQQLIMTTDDPANITAAISEARNLLSSDGTPALNMTGSAALGALTATGAMTLV